MNKQRALWLAGAFILGPLTLVAASCAFAPVGGPAPGAVYAEPGIDYYETYGGPDFAFYGHNYRVGPYRYGGHHGGGMPSIAGDHGFGGHGGGGHR